MDITWLGHSTFLLETAGTRIVTDPYNDSVGYDPIDTEADVVSISHEHADHNAVDQVRGAPETVRGVGRLQARGIRFRGIGTFHDDAHGAKRGPNTIYVIEAEGLKVCHAGDLGHLLTAEQAREVGQVDVLLVPVGGNFTIDAKQARLVAERLGARVIIPMHYKTAKLGFPIAGIEPFVKSASGVRYARAASVEVTKDALPEKPEIVVLDHLR